MSISRSLVATVALTLLAVPALQFASALPPTPALPTPFSLPAPVEALTHGPPADWQDLLAVNEANLLGAPLAPAQAAPATLPSEGILGVLAVAGVDASAVSPAQLAAYDALPRAPRDALSSLLNSYLAAARLADGAVAPFTSEDLARVAGPDLDAEPIPVDFAALLSGQRTLLAAAQEAIPVFREYQEVMAELPPVEACLALLLDFTPTGDVHVCEVRFAIDANGDDLWLNNAGGSGEAVPLSGNFGAAAPAFALELAGNDRYEPVLSQGGAIGGGFSTTGLLVEVAGDDRYAGSVRLAGTLNGGGEVGAGFHLDVAGNDYHSGAVGLDLQFHNEGGGVNGGSTAGSGVSVDFAGNDVYTGTLSGSGGINSGSHGGAAALFDFGEGQDSYWGSVGTLGGINGGVFTGAAVLLDGGGDDTYDGWQGSLGGVNGGAFIGVGLLVDQGGNDRYDGTNMLDGGVNGGSFLPLGKGALVDFGGDDFFTGWLGGPGGINGGSFFGIGRLDNRGGNDVYDTRIAGGLTIGVNGATFFGAGQLLDVGGGEDYYRDVPGGTFDKDETIILKGTAGFQMDCPDMNQAIAGFPNPPSCMRLP